VGGCALVLALAFGCGGTTQHGGPSGAAGSATQGGGAPSRAGSSAGGSGGTGRAGAPTSGGTRMDPDPPVDKPPVDAGCPMADLPAPQLECDPFKAGDCGPDLGCYPFVEHPEGNGCGEQQYGTVCLPAGSGTQGEFCGDDVGDYCAPGFVCVVGQRAGKRCAALCQLGKPNQCTGGLICGDLDVAGYGVCG
jgi:hypothetical protein